MTEPTECAWCGTIHNLGQNTLCPLTLAAMRKHETDREDALAHGLRRAVQLLDIERQTVVNAQTEIKTVRQVLNG